MELRFKQSANQALSSVVVFELDEDDKGDHRTLEFVKVCQK